MEAKKRFIVILPRGREKGETNVFPHTLFFSLQENPNRREMNTAFNSRSVGGSEVYVKKDKRYWKLELQDR